MGKRAAAAGRTPPRVAPDLPPAAHPLVAGLDWEAVHVTGDHTGLDASHFSVTECRITNARFTAASLHKVHLSDCVISDSDFVGASLAELNATRVELTRCRMSSVDVAGAHLRDVAFFDCKLDGANLRMTTWERCELVDCDLSEADLASARLDGTRVFGCDLSSAQLSKASLAGARLHGSRLESVKSVESLKGAVIGSDQMVPVALALLAAVGITVEDER
ncbi:MAG TPA: pentapeptide repeat-containing protein [Acidimicrobiales bacterium]|nr:pentapeptide repeat-containing protein [Acidimicrobiales bacterium]